MDVDDLIDQLDEFNELDVDGLSEDDDDKKCGECDKRFSRRSNLRKHMRTVHGNQLKKTFQMCLAFKCIQYLIKRISDFLLLWLGLIDINDVISKLCPLKPMPCHGAIRTAGVRLY